MSATPGSVIEDDKRARFVWIGAVTPNSFKINVDVLQNEPELLVSRDGTFAPSQIVTCIAEATTPTPDVDTSIFGALRHFSVTGLDAAMRYHVGLRRTDGTTVRVAAVTTFPTENTSAEVVLALGSCQFRARDGRALGEIARWRSALEATNPATAFVMVHVGDLHYSNIATNSQELFEDAIRSTVTKSRAATLFRSTPVAYCWDDHDYGANNSGADSPAREAALAAHKAMVPSPAAPGVVYHAFTVARVRVILTDLRSEARPERGEAMSETQLRFLFSELAGWRGFDAVVWASSRPWIERAAEGSDRWGGFAAQRRTIANFIAEQGIDNLVLVSGDAHMLAADDGSNSCYADEKYAARGFPVLHAAPLSNVGTVKGGPYSEGVETRRLWKTRQYAMLRIRPAVKEGRAVQIEFDGYKVSPLPTRNAKSLLKKKAVLSFKVERPFFAKQKCEPEDTDKTCSQSFNFIDWISNKFS